MSNQIKLEQLQLAAKAAWATAKKTEEMAATVDAMAAAASAAADAAWDAARAAEIAVADAVADAKAWDVAWDAWCAARANDAAQVARYEANEAHINAPSGDEAPVKFITMYTTKED